MYPSVSFQEPHSGTPGWFAAHDVKITRVPQNLGCYNGACARAQILLGREIQICVCLLHMLELPTKAYYKYLFGESHGPEHPGSDPVSEAIRGDLREAPIYDFEPLPGRVAEDITKEDKREAKLKSGDKSYVAVEGDDEMMVMVLMMILIELVLRKLFLI